MLQFNIYNVTCYNIINLHVDIIHLACLGQKYAYVFMHRSALKIALSAQHIHILLVVRLFLFKIKKTIIQLFLYVPHHLCGLSVVSCINQLPFLLKHGFVPETSCTVGKSTVLMKNYMHAIQSVCPKGDKLFVFASNCKVLSKDHSSVYF